MIRPLRIALLAVSLGLVLSACQSVELPAVPSPGSVEVVPTATVIESPAPAETTPAAETTAPPDTTPAQAEEPAATLAITPTAGLQTPSLPETVATATVVDPSADPAAVAAEDMPEAVAAAQQALAEELEIPVEEVTVVSFEWMEWPDACLGAAQPDEMCAAVITPGYQVMMEAEGQPYEIHTNDDGSVWRLVQRRIR